MIPGGIKTHIRTPDGATESEIHKRGRGIIDTLDEAQGDILADLDTMRRADVKLRISDTV